MSKAKIYDINKQVKQQDQDNYGEETVSGSSPDPGSDDDVAETLKQTVGVDLKRGEEFNLAEKVKKDERARRTKPKI